jgi:hypothetical protein
VWWGSSFALWDSRRQAGGGVHWDVKGDEVGPPEYVFIETLHGEVHRPHSGTTFPQHCGWLG